MRGHCRLLAPALLTGLLAACAGDPGGPPAATHELPPATAGRAVGEATHVAAAPAAGATASPAPSAPLTTLAAPGMMPAVARQRTPEGAEAFVRHFVDQVNAAWTRPQTGLISALSLPTCQACQALEQRAASLTSEGARYGSPSLTLRDVQWGADKASGEDVVTAVVEERAVPTIGGDAPHSASGRVNATPSSFELRWQASKWVVAELKTLK